MFFGASAKSKECLPPFVFNYPLGFALASVALVSDRKAGKEALSIPGTLRTCANWVSILQEKGALDREECTSDPMPTASFLLLPAFVANSLEAATMWERIFEVFYYFPPFVWKTCTSFSHLQSRSCKGIRNAVGMTAREESDILSYGLHYCLLSGVQLKLCVLVEGNGSLQSRKGATFEGFALALT